MLDDAEQNGFSDVVSWNSNGFSFKVHKPMEFSDNIMLSKYFQKTKYTSFQRQLNLYGFVRTHHGDHKGSYSHKHFRREDPSLSLLHRQKIAIVKQAPTPSRAHGHSNNTSLSMQAIMDFEAPSSSVCWWDEEEEDKKAEESVADTYTLLDFPETDDLNIAFDAGDVFPNNNEPLFVQSMTTSMNDDPNLPLLEWNQLMISDLIDVQEKEVEIEASARQPQHSFPWKLHDMLEEAESNNVSHIVSWGPYGLSFKVHMRDEFVTKIMPLYFNQTKYESFRRQLNLYGFTRGNYGVHFHASFMKGDRSLCKKVKRKQHHF
jgi:hypothetical protein